LHSYKYARDANKRRPSCCVQTQDIGCVQKRRREMKQQNIIDTGRTKFVQAAQQFNKQPGVSQILQSMDCAGVWQKGISYPNTGHDHQPPKALSKLLTTLICNFTAPHLDVHPGLKLLRARLSSSITQCIHCSTARAHEKAAHPRVSQPASHTAGSTHLPLLRSHLQPRGSSHYSQERPGGFTSATWRALQGIEKLSRQGGC
jgi:hypothetical protein